MAGAHNDYSRFLEIHADDGPAWLCRHIAHAHLADWPKADADYARAVEKTHAVRPRTDCRWTHRNEIKAAGDTRRWQEIALDLKVLPNPGMPAWWAWRARALSEAASGLWKDADACFSRAIEGKRRRLGELARPRAGRRGAAHWTSAIADCSRAIELKGSDWASWYTRGIACSFQRPPQYDKAISDLSRAIELGADGWGVVGDRGYAYLQTWDLNHGLADYTVVIRRNPDAISYNNRGVAYIRMGEFDKAILDFNDAIRLDPKFALSFANRADSYRKKGDCPRAINDATEAIKIEARLSLAYLIRADAYADADIPEFEKAIDDYTRALDQTRNNTYNLSPPGCGLRRREGLRQGHRRLFGVGR